MAMIDLPGGPLMRRDLESLESRWITPELADTAGIRRVDSLTGSQLVGRNGKCDCAGLALPNIFPGELQPREYRLRRDSPDFEYRADGTKREIGKYLGPPDRPPLPYFPVGVTPEMLADVTLPVIVCEGELKSLALARLAHWQAEKPRFLPIGLQGVDGWRGIIGKTQNAAGKRVSVKGMLPDLADKVAWKNRPAIIAYDAGADTNDRVEKARRRLMYALIDLGAKVGFLEWPADQGKGIDDRLANIGPERVLDDIAPCEFGRRPGSSADEWPDFIPFARPQPDDFESWLPGWLGEMAEATAAATETPLALSSLLSLAVASASIAAKAVVSPEPGYEEPLNIYTCPSMESGNRKTAALKLVLAPLAAWEAEEMERTAPRRKVLESERKTTEVRIEKLRRDSARKGDDPAILAEIRKLEANLPTVPPVPRVWVDDCTPEALAILMYERNERMAVLSDEGGIFETLAGRYSKGVPNLDLWLKAHSVSPVRVDRVDVARPPIILNRPHLTVGISPQPDVLEALRDKPGFRGRGLLARFLYALPKSPLGYRTLEPQPVPAAIADRYRVGIRQLLEVPLGAAVRLRLSVEAYQEWKAFQKAIELQLRDGGKLDGLRDWGSKLPGACLRLAGIFHAVERGGFVDPEISHGTIQRALDLGACLISHAQCVFDLMERDPNIEDAERLLAWIVSRDEPTFTVRDCFRAHQRRFTRVDALLPVLALLQEHCHIRRVEGESRGGRPPSDTCRVNPKLLKTGGKRL
jgi:hypothetical protein